jgi:hypothetical protein
MPSRAVIVVDTQCRDLLTALAAELHTLHGHPVVTPRELVEALIRYCANVVRIGAAVGPFDFAHYREVQHGERA